MNEPVRLTITRDFAAPPTRVFDAWLDPAQARRFLFATPGGEMLTCAIDARVGGEALIVERRASGDAAHRLRFEVIDRPRRLVFLFGADPAPPDQWTRVTLDLAPLPGGGTQLTLTHEMAPEWADYADRTREGWTMILETLGKTLENDHG